MADEQRQRAAEWEKQSNPKDAVFGLHESGKTKSDKRWSHDARRWLRDNLRWIVALTTSTSIAAAFFLITGNDPFENFIELVLALAVGGTISAAASFRVVRGSADNDGNVTAPVARGGP